MRRRDAHRQCTHSFRLASRQAVVSATLSFAVHLAVLVTVATAVVRTNRPIDLIRVTLWFGDGEAGARASAPAAAAPAAPNPPANPERGATRSPQLPPYPVDHHIRVAGRHAQRQPVPSPARNRGAAVIANVAEAPRAAAGAGAAEAGGSGGTLADGQGVGGAGAGRGGRAGGAGDGIDPRAYCVYCPEPHYPLVARARGWQGTVDVVLSVLADGSVNGARLRRSSGYGVLDDAAVAVARQSRFSPPALHGLRAPLHGRIQYRFELTAAR